jgi:transposase
VCYAAKHAQLSELERLCRAGELTLLYGDESHVCSEGYVPYGWQFPGETVFVAAQKGFRLNCWGLFGRDNQCHWATSTSNITAAFVIEQLDRLSLQVSQPTVVVLDNASIHTATSVLQCRAVWEERDLYLFFLPAYSPHLNIAETVWRHLKGGWLRPEDYAQPDDLAYATNRCLANFGKQLRIDFSPFNEN